jgi:glycosyltransferase involved in cell wall biosynthesis
MSGLWTRPRVWGRVDGSEREEAPGLEARHEPMRITVLTPTLNAARFLPGCLESVRTQDWPRERTQHLVLDGRSTDGTAAIATASGAEVSVEKDASLYEAVNRGVGLATGDVIGWLNADDTLMPGALAAVAGAFERAPDLDLVVGDCCYAYPWGTMVRRGSARSLQRIRAGSTSPQWVVPLAAWYRAEVLKRLGPYDARYRITADLDLWFRAANASPPLRVAHAGCVLGTFRVHEESLSSGRSLSTTREETLAVCSRWMEDPAVPRGIRRHARYIHRRDQLFQRVETDAPSEPLHRMLWILREVGRLRPRGIGAGWDARVLLLGTTLQAGKHLARSIVGVGRRSDG